jgi:hypothetical protein
MEVQDDDNTPRVTSLGFRIDKTAGDSERFKFGDPSLEQHYLCYFCGLSHKRVEAGGMWFCPNFTCMGPGNHGFRKRNLKSYKEVENQRHTVDDQEWKELAENLTLSPEEWEGGMREAVQTGIKMLHTLVTAARYNV